tara:strand:- start:1887 stop:2366 length:480 start_codon:yes stop_codon:yes gene_type:complete
MRHDIKTVIFGWFIIIGAAVFGFYLGQERNWTAKSLDLNIQKVIDGDTDLIQSVALAAEKQSDNADIILQILNALNGKPVKELPKSINGLLLSDQPEFKIEDGDEEVNLTFEQIAKDQIEIKLGIRSLASGSLFQAQALHNILEKIKTQQENHKNTNSP